MSEFDNSYLIKTLDVLTKTLVELMKLHCTPGDKAHKLWSSIEFVERQIKDIIKEIKRVEK